MSTHTAHFGFGLHGLRARLHMPPATRAGQRAPAAPATPWLERLAAWAERQPRHHHLGSCHCL
jgi:hypothetical protein